MKTIYAARETNYTSAVEVLEGLEHLALNDAGCTDARPFKAAPGAVVRIGDTCLETPPPGTALVYRRRFSTSFAHLRRADDHLDVYWPTEALDPPGENA